MVGTTIERFRRLPQAARWSIGLVVILVGLNLVGVALDAIYGGASPGPSSSSYTTDPSGTAAFAELLELDGRDVVRSREELASSNLEESETLIVLEPSTMTDDDIRSIVRFVADGGRLVLAVADDPFWLDNILPGAPTWSRAGTERSQALVPIEETAGVRSVAAAGFGSWVDAEDSLAILGDDLVTATVADLGEGRIVMLADPSMIQNAYLDQDDNAAFALAVVGEDRPVVFAETFHGYERATGFAALPDRARTALLLLCVGFLLMMLAYGRRFGPPDRSARDLPPPRRAYVDALAATLARTRDADAAIQPLRERGRAALAASLNVPDTTSDEMLRSAAEERGVGRQANVLLQPIRNDDDLISVGRVAVQLIRGAR